MSTVAEFVRDGGSLRDDADFLREMVANTSEGLLTIDADSVIVFANPAIEDVLGYPPDELVGSSKMKIIPERLRDAHAAGLEQYLRTGDRHIDWTGVELPALHADGHEVPVSVSIRDHEFRGERVFTGIFTDVSDRKRRERTLREQKRELEEFADVLAHDLRNPLTVAKAQLALAEDGREESFETAEEALDRIDRIIEDTLTRARHGTDDETIETLALRDVAEAAWGTVDTRDATLSLPDGWYLRANRGRLRQLFENLYRNAVEHGGDDASVTVGVLGDGGGFYVEDDGPGFPDDVPDTSDAVGNGHYGLHIVGTVANEHGWGTTFTAGDAGGARVEFDRVGLAEKG